MNQVVIKTPNGWRVATILPIPAQHLPSGKL
jgi:hypothetical protein